MNDIEYIEYEDDIIEEITDEEISIKPSITSATPSNTKNAYVCYRQGTSGDYSIQAFLKQSGAILSINEDTSKQYSIDCFCGDSSVGATARFLNTQCDSYKQNIFIKGAWNTTGTYSSTLITALRNNGYNYIWATSQLNPSSGQGMLAQVFHLKDDASGRPLFYMFDTVYNTQNTKIFKYTGSVVSYNWTYNVLLCRPVYFCSKDGSKFYYWLYQLNLNGEPYSYTTSSETRYIAYYNDAKFKILNNSGAPISVIFYSKYYSYCKYQPIRLNDGAENYINFNAVDTMSSYMYVYAQKNYFPVAFSFYVKNTTNNISEFLNSIYIYWKKPGYSSYDNYPFASGYELYEKKWYVKTADVWRGETDDTSKLCFAGTVDTASRVDVLKTLCAQHLYNKPFSKKENYDWLTQGTAVIIPTKLSNATDQVLFADDAKLSYMDYSGGNYILDSRYVIVPCVNIKNNLDSNMEVKTFNWTVPTDDTYQIPKENNNSSISITNSNTSSKKVKITCDGVESYKTIPASSTETISLTINDTVIIDIVENAAHIYVGGEWKDAQAKIYVSGEWKDCTAYVWKDGWHQTS